MLVEEGHVAEADFPWETDGYREPTPAADIIDGVPYDGKQPNAYLDSLTIGLKSGEIVEGKRSRQECNVTAKLGRPDNSSSHPGDACLFLSGNSNKNGPESMTDITSPNMASSGPTSGPTARQQRMFAAINKASSWLDALGIVLADPFAQTRRW